jgi:hypothetical protein
LKYGRAGPAIITNAIANPASNEILSIIILLTHFAPPEPFCVTARQIVISRLVLSLYERGAFTLRAALLGPGRICVEKKYVRNASGKPVESKSKE